MTKQFRTVFLVGKKAEAENTLARLVKENYGDTGVEYLVGRLSSVITESQLKVLIDYEKGVNG
jgi:hypothetical protein